METKTLIVVNITAEGVHQWKDCNIKEVEYLLNLHRHNFYINVKKEVSHDDRDIEIIKFKKQIINYLHKRFWNLELQLLDFQLLSCEQMAKIIYKEFDCYSVEVLEDNENGAIVL